MQNNQWLYIKTGDMEKTTFVITVCSLLYLIPLKPRVGEQLMKTV